MIKKILICDRCGKEVEKAFRIEVYSVNPEENDGETVPFSRTLKDFCADCLTEIRNTAETLTMTVPMPEELRPLMQPDPEPSRIPEVHTALYVGPDPTPSTTDPEPLPSEPEPEPEEPADLAPTVPEAEPVAPTTPPAEEPEPKPKKKQYHAKTLYLMKQAGRSVDEIAEETGYSPATVYAKLKKFKEEGRLC